jgi:rubrerythrin
MGKIRIETMDDLLLARKTEVQREVPILYTNTVLDRVDAAIPEEKEATDDYAELENQLREAAAMAEKSGNHDKAVFLSSAADTVSEIRTDEMDHLAKFLQMHKTLDDLGFKLTGD